MIHRLDGRGKQGAQKEAQGGHQGLKAAEPHPAGQFRTQRSLLHGKSLTHGHGEGIHTQTHRQQNQFSDSHKKASVPEFRKPEVSLNRHRSCKETEPAFQVSSFQVEPGFPQYVDSAPGLPADYSLFWVKL